MATQGIRYREGSHRMMGLDDKSLATEITLLYISGKNVPLTDEEISRASHGFLHALKVFYEKLSSLGDKFVLAAMYVIDSNGNGIVLVCVPERGECPGRLFWCNLEGRIAFNCENTVERLSWPLKGRPESIMIFYE